MGRRGFFAELQHQVRLASREQERRQREAYRAHAVAERAAEQSRKLAERAAVVASRAAEVDRKRLEKEARDAHVKAQEAEALELNERLRQAYDEVDLLLSSTLGVDDYVNLRTLRVVVRHPPFEHPELEAPVPTPSAIPYPPKPTLALPPEPSGIAGFFGKGKHAERVAAANKAHEVALRAWEQARQEVDAKRKRQEQTHAREEAVRAEKLAVARERYRGECAAREAEAAEQNGKLLTLIANLGYGVPEAVQEYISIVLANSAYPEHFPVSHDFEFDPATAELRLSVTVPGPDSIPVIKSYKYAKSTDEIVGSTLSQKECRDRYAGAVHQVALRSFHEIFESDRQGLIATISLEVGTNSVDRATGQKGYVPLVVASAAREAFVAFNLAEVVPALTLQKLGASVSKNPYALAPAERSGVRRA